MTRRWVRPTSRVVGDGDDDPGPVAAVAGGEGILGVAVGHGEESVGSSHGGGDDLGVRVEGSFFGGGVGVDDPDERLRGGGGEAAADQH
ncbi:MAG: hypothetical protein WCF12_12855 [Propionicimonas sp.]